LRPLIVRQKYGIANPAGLIEACEINLRY
jgi:hypothetical protein